MRPFTTSRDLARMRKSLCIPGAAILLGMAMALGSDDAIAQTTSIPPEGANAPVRVSIKMQDQSWIRITADGEVAFEGIMKEGDSKFWTAEEQLKIRAGNAGGVLVSFNEGNEQLLGRPGMVTEVIYPPEDTAQLTTPRP